MEQKSYHSFTLAVTARPKAPLSHTHLRNHPSSNGNTETNVGTHKDDIRAAIEAAPGGISDVYWCFAAQETNDKNDFIPKPTQKKSPRPLQFKLF